MNLTLDLADEKLAAWKSQAEAAGMTVESWLQELADQRVLAAAAAPLAPPIWEIIANRAASLPETVLDRQPADGASEHDHYLYGHPKRNR